MKKSLFTLALLLTTLTVSINNAQGQDAKPRIEDAKPITSIYEVHEGMTKEFVVKALGPKYDLRTLLPSRDGYEVLLARSRSSPTEETEIHFFEEKVTLTRRLLYDSNSVDAVKFAQELQFLLHAVADPPSRPTALEKASNVRNATAEIQTQQRSAPEISDSGVFITVGSRTFRIWITQVPGNPSKAEITEELK